jgi:hypothetical protein
MLLLPRNNLEKKIGIKSAEHGFRDTVNVLRRMTKAEIVLSSTSCNLPIVNQRDELLEMGYF